MRDAIKYGFFLLSLISLPGKAQPAIDSIQVRLPDTVISVQNTLFFIEGRAPVYFSYNPGIFIKDSTAEWFTGTYPLRQILDRIAEGRDLLYTLIGNQVVFYRRGEDPSSIPSAEGAAPPPLKIRGLVIGKEEEIPLPYANIWFPETWEGTVANSEGFFAINIPAGYSEDTLAISCMGFRTRRLAISDLNDSLNTIYLEASLIPIQEVVIRRTNPIYLIRLAISRIPDNNSRDPVIETAFYRESVRKNEQYVSVSEAVVDVYKPGFESMSSEQVRVLRARKNVDFDGIDTIFVKIKAGLETSFLLDVIRNRPEFLQDENLNKYEYRMSDIVVIQDKMAYAIDFKRKPETDPPHYRGRIYIDLDNFAIREVEFGLDPETISNVAGSMVLRKPRYVRVRPLSAEYSVSYKEEGGLYHVSLIRADNRFRIRQHKKLFGNEYRTTSEMAVTGLDTSVVSRFRNRETVNPRDIFTDIAGGNDPAFWGPYNTIIPDESLEDALLRIGRMMEIHEPLKE